MQLYNSGSTLMESVWELECMLPGSSQVSGGCTFVDVKN